MLGPARARRSSATGGPKPAAPWIAPRRMATTSAGPHIPRIQPCSRTIVDPPLLLWTRGDAALLDAPAVALVGSRESTTAGREVAFRLAADLAAAGVIVTSGFARGIDAAAHRGALTTGRSMAVLGCGLDQPYPSDHGPLGCDAGGGWRPGQRVPARRATARPSLPPPQPCPQRPLPRSRRRTGRSSGAVR